MPYIPLPNGPPESPEPEWHDDPGVLTPATQIGRVQGRDLATSVAVLLILSPLWGLLAGWGWRVFRLSAGWR